MSLETTLILGLAEAAKTAIKLLAKRYFVEDGEILAPTVRRQYDDAIEAGTRAFAKQLEARGEISTEGSRIVADFFKSEIIAEELSKLLDPGVEFFDEGELSTTLLKVLWDNDCFEITELQILEAWQAFSKAYSFASRSTPELREFLRASYEAGSFRAISSIGDILSRLEHEIGYLSAQEDQLAKGLRDYGEELKGYKYWAKKFGERVQ